MDFTISRYAWFLMFKFGPDASRVLRDYDILLFERPGGMLESRLLPGFYLCNCVKMRSSIHRFGYVLSSIVSDSGLHSANGTMGLVLP